MCIRIDFFLSPWCESTCVCDADDYDDEAGQYGVQLMDDIMPVDPVRWPGALDLREPRLRLIGCHIRTSSLAWAMKITSTQSATASELTGVLSTKHRLQKYLTYSRVCVLIVPTVLQKSTSKLVIEFSWEKRESILAIKLHLTLNSIEQIREYVILIN